MKYQVGDLVQLTGDLWKGSSYGDIHNKMALILKVTDAFRPYNICTQGATDQSGFWFLDGGYSVTLLDRRNNCGKI